MTAWDQVQRRAAHETMTSQVHHNQNKSNTVAQNETNIACVAHIHTMGKVAQHSANNAFSQSNTMTSQHRKYMTYKVHTPQSDCGSRARSAARFAGAI